MLVPPKYFLGLEVQADRSHEFRIPYKAYPPVTASWSHTVQGETHKLEDGGRYAILVDEKTVSLRISGCTRADVGEYHIHVQNAVGTDAATVKLTVMDKPEPPVYFCFVQLLIINSTPNCRDSPRWRMCWTRRQFSLGSPQHWTEAHW